MSLIRTTKTDKKNRRTEYEDVEITGDLLKKFFHSLMLGTISRDAGKYKQQNNWIQERDGRGRIKIQETAVPSISESKELIQMNALEIRNRKIINAVIRKEQIGRAHV